MTLEYDEAKNRKNIKKHKISFETASLFMDSDPNPDVEFDFVHSNIDDIRFRGTFRWNDKYLFIVYTMRGDADGTLGSDPIKIESISLVFEYAEFSIFYKRNRKR